MELNSNVILKKDEYTLVNKDSRISSNRLPARVSSFEHIKNAWKKSLLTQNSLGEMSVPEKEVVVSSSAPVEVETKTVPSVSSAVEEKIASSVPVKEEVKPISSASSTAKVELSPSSNPAVEYANAVIISRENLPNKLEKSRALRLREDMRKNIVSHSNSIYSKGLAVDKDRVDKNDKAEFIDNPEVVSYQDYLENKPIIDEVKKEDIDVKKISDANIDSITSEINTSMNDASVHLEEVVNPDLVSLNPIAPVSPIELVDDKDSLAKEDESVKPTVPIRDSVIVAAERKEAPVNSAEMEPVIKVETVNEAISSADVVEKKDEVVSSHNISESATVIENKDDSVSDNVGDLVSAAKEDYLKSLEVVNEAKQKENEKADIAKKIVREKIEKYAIYKRMKEKALAVCNDYSKKAEDNRALADTILQGLGKLDNYIDEQSVDLNNYSNKIDKLAAILGDEASLDDNSDYLNSEVEEEKVRRR